MRGNITIQCIKSVFFCSFENITHLINAPNIEHIKHDNLYSCVQKAVTLQNRKSELRR